MGPATGIHAYDQSLSRLPDIGSTKWAMRGPKSRAGLMAYPVGPPNPIPMPATSNATGNASNAPSELVGADAANAPKASTNVPMSSVKKLENEWRMAGEVLNTPSLRSGSSVASKCKRKAAHVPTAPQNAPAIWAAM